MIHDNAWAGQTVRVIGGGPSIKFLLDHLKDLPHSIGTNMAFTLNPTINLVGDERLQKQLMCDPDYVAYGGIKFGIDNSPVNWLGSTRFRPMKGWSNSLEDGLIWHSNTGLAAINLAYILGGMSSRIVLYGFDLASPEKLSANWHGAYAEEWKTNADQLYERMIEDMEETLGQFDRLELKIVTERDYHPLQDICLAQRITFEEAQKL